MEKRKLACYEIFRFSVFSVYMRVFHKNPSPASCKDAKAPSLSKIILAP